MSREALRKLAALGEWHTAGNEAAHSRAGHALPPVCSHRRHLRSQHLQGALAGGAGIAPGFVMIR